MTSAGDLVTLRGESWLVSRAEAFEACTILTLEGRGLDNSGQRFRLVEPFDRPVAARHERPRRRRRDSVLRSTAAAVARDRPADGLWTAATARLTLLPYQLEPALAVLDGATRLLLADEVGLGKTVQAALVLAELQARGLADRALIVTPAGLRDTWAQELRDRFGMQPTILDQTTIAPSLSGLPVGINPWASHGIVIASIDLVKRPEVLAAVEEAPFDVLIADEAHHLTPGSDRGAAIDRLASRVPWVVLVSATPHSGDAGAFAYLTRLGALGDELAVFRRTRRDMSLTHGRRVRWLAVRPSPHEADMLRATKAYARAIWRARGATDRAVRLVAMTLARRAASSATALERTLVRRLALLADEDVPVPAQPLLPWDETTADEGDEDEACLGRRGLDDGHEERRQLLLLIALARDAQSNASKIHRIQRLVARAGEPAVIFTEYRDTLDALAPALAPHRSVATIHGGLPRALRQDAIDRFTRGGVDLLLATDAAGEGLNLHHRCRLVINVELPWNPLRLEQRIGRVDRLGQTRRVHAIHLFHRGTIEDTVLAHLERRRARAAATLDGAGRDWMGEDDIGAAAFEDRPVVPRPASHLATTAVHRAVGEAARLEAHRARPPATPAAMNRPAWALPRHQTPAPRHVVLVYEVQHSTALGRLIDERVASLVVEIARPARTRREWRLLIDRLSRDEAVQAAIAHEAERRLPDLDRALGQFGVTRVARIDAIRASLGHSCGAVVQSSLFDRRAERKTETRRAIVARLDAHLARRASLLHIDSPAGIASRIRLVAAWPIER